MQKFACVTCMMHSKIDVYILQLKKKLIIKMYFLINKMHNVCT